ncbi:hypothetical protein HOL34_03075 [bacterium]|jgi:hypothetical protein|nr:hypothetical protein [bacterium]MBT3903288.1 hypothetical protein [bacterium]MBT4577487.1 hypothetical protein [bacterium]MBT5345797.1 hypothetical protein [bacterium]MBT6130862.1 hypothetical protein [bacterium]
MKRLLLIGLSTIALASTGSSVSHDNTLCDRDIHGRLTEAEMELYGIDIDDLETGICDFEEMFRCNVREVLDGSLGESLSPRLKKEIGPVVDEFREAMLMLEDLLGRSIEELLGRE